MPKTKNFSPVSEAEPEVGVTPNSIWNGRLALSPEEAAAASGLSRTLIYSEMKAGRLKSATVGGRRVILVADLTALLRGLGRAS